MTLSHRRARRVLLVALPLLLLPLTACGKKIAEVTAHEPSYRSSDGTAENNGNYLLEGSQGTRYEDLSLFASTFTSYTPSPESRYSLDFRLEGMAREKEFVTKNMLVNVCLSVTGAEADCGYQPVKVTEVQVEQSSAGKLSYYGTLPLPVQAGQLDKQQKVFITMEYCEGTCAKLNLNFNRDTVGEQVDSRQQERRNNPYLRTSTASESSF